MMTDKEIEYEMDRYDEIEDDINVLEAQKHFMEQTVKELNKATEAYDKGTPIMSDKQWDDLYFMLQMVEEELGYTLPDSPTQKIIYQAPVLELNKVNHNHRMLSLAKTKSIDEVNAFLNDRESIVMCKMDGLTCSLLYENGKLVRAETRGDGLVGEDVTHNAMVIPSIPKTIPYKERLVVDGEIICRYGDFEAFSGEYKNPRNFAAGSIRLLDSRECEKRHLTFVVWDIIEGFNEKELLSKKLFSLDVYGFTIVPFIMLKHLNTDIIEWVQEIAKKRGFPIDGAVIKINDIAYGKSLGQTAHHFNNAIAYKFYDETYSTKLLDIEWTMGRTGILTPVAILEPIEIDGSTVERASLHNSSMLQETIGMAPYKGMEVEVFKANMIIPQIKPIKELDKVRNTIDKEFHNILDNPKGLPYLYEPLVCPCCRGLLIHKDTGSVKVLFCPSPNCDGKLINRLDHFCGKKGLDIKGLSKATLEKLIDWDWVLNPYDLFELKKYRDTWIKQPGFGVKSVDKILNAIENARNTTLDKVISSAGIPLIGSTVAKVLSKQFKTYKNFRDAIDNGEDFTLYEGFGPEMHKALSSFDYSSLDELVKDFLIFSEETLEKENSVANNDLLKDKIFVITGKLKGYKNRDELKSKIESLGGKVAGSVSSKTNYLINNDANSSSAKNTSAKKLGVQIITEEEFHKIFDI